VAKRPRHRRSGLYGRRRRAVLRQAARQAKLDAMLVTSPQDVRYLTGFTGDDSVVVFARAWACLVTDGRYSQRAAGECGDIAVHVRSGSMSKAIAAVLAGKGVRRLGVQADHVTLKYRCALAAAIGGRRIRPVCDVVAPLRALKDASELVAIGKAVRIAERAFRALLAGGAKALVGRTERDVAAELDYLMRRFGATGSAFETMVAAGPGAANPHYTPGDTRIRRNQAVLVDWGAVADGYCSDLTRVVLIGRIPPKVVDAYEVVLRAQSAAITAVAPGVKMASVDAAGRRIVARAGYGEAFTHSLGHGLGREVHEQPILSRLAKGRLRKGMVVTVEPGIYLPGLGGVRVEDDVLVTSTGRRRISSLPRRAASVRLD